MRDVIVMILVLGTLPYIVLRPWIGVLVWTWLSLMNPHRLAWGFAYDFPFVMIVAALTLGMLPFARQQKSLPWSPLLIVWFLWIGWMSLSTPFALVPEEAVPEWERTMKIQLMILATLVLIRTRTQIEALVWVLAFSIGFFGIKGGLFTVLTGGNYLVWGPLGSFITGNNEVALAILTVLPLFRYLQVRATNKWVARAMLACMLLCAAAVLGSWSRGALVGAAAMFMVMWLKTKRKWLSGMAIAVAGAVFLAFLPQGWFDRMSTIKDYDQDASALGRINAWGFAVNLANDRPIVGGGFRAFDPDLFLRYAPIPDDFHDAHSIYFEVLGEHGYIGLLLFVSVAALSYGMGRRIKRLSEGREDLRWAADLASMVQVSLVGYGVGGAFLGLAYFDLPYCLMAVMLLTKAEVVRTLAATPGQKLQSQHSHPASPVGSVGASRPSMQT